MTTVKIHKRDDCRVCGNNTLVRWVHLPQMPLTDDLRKSDNHDEFLSDIDVYYCTSCNVSQTLKIIDLEEYYLDYAYTVAGSRMANTFMSKLASKTYETYHLQSNSVVLEVGSGDGNQLAYFKRLGANVFGFEPSADLCRKSLEINVPVYQGLFSKSSIPLVPTEYLNADVLLLTYTFDHIPEPIDFLEAAHDILNPQSGLLIIEVHDLDKIVNRREYCLFEHEHFIYLNIDTMRTVLEQTGFTLLSSELLAESERRGNSLLIVATPSDSIRAKEASSELKSHNIINYEAFNQEMLAGIDKLDDFVNQQIAMGKSIAGYGAGGRGVMTLAAMKSANKLAYVCDSNPSFHGYCTPKSRVPIQSPNYLSIQEVDVLLVFSYGYLDEIKELVLSITNKPIEIVSMLEFL